MKEATIFLLGFTACLIVTSADSGAWFRCNVFGDCVMRGLQ